MIIETSMCESSSIFARISAEARPENVNKNSWGAGGCKRLPRGNRTFSLRFHFLRCGIIARVTNRNTQFRAGHSYNAIARSCFDNVGPANLSLTHIHSRTHMHAQYFSKLCNDTS